MNPGTQKHRLTVPAPELSAAQVALAPSSQSACVRQSGSLGVAHCSCSPSFVPHVAGGCAVSNPTKLRYALQNRGATLTLYDVDEPPATNVQHSGSGAHAEAVDPAAAAYAWQGEAEEQLSGDCSSAAVQLSSMMVLPALTLKGSDEFSCTPRDSAAPTETQAAGETKGAGATTRLCVAAEMEVIGYEVPLSASKKSVDEVHRTLYDGSPQPAAVLSGYGTAVEPQGGHTRAWLFAGSSTRTRARVLVIWRRSRRKRT